MNRGEQRELGRAKEGTVNAGRAFVAGVIGALAMSFIMIWLRVIGVPLHIESQLAAALGTRMWVVGLLAHVVIGGLIAIVFALVFEFVLNESGVGPGLMVGACNTIFAGFVWTAQGGPGSLRHTLGPSGIGALFLLQMMFGAIVGGLYRTRHALVYE
jgi:hypothetical protein